MKLKLKYFTGLLFVMLALYSNSQISSFYTFFQSTGTYAAVTGGTQLGTTSSDDELFITNVSGSASAQTAAGFAIGFTFNYNGANYTQFGVSTNGYIMLGNLPSFTMPINSCNCFGNASSGTINVDNGIALFANSNIISALNYDLVGQTGSTLQYLTTGTSPNRVLTIQWSVFSSFGLTDNYNFQINLFETWNKIQFCYGSFTHDATVEDARVGLYGTSNTDFFMRTGSANWTTTTNGSTSGASVAFVNSVLPTNGLIFEYIPTSTLPIELISFNANQSEETVQLSWSTATETDNEFFTIEKSKDCKNFTQLMNVPAYGNSNSVKKYFEVDNEPYPETSYYRLKQTDKNGAFKYFTLVSVDFKEHNSIEIFPNPATSEEINIKLSGYQNQEVAVLVNNMQGENLYSKKLVAENNCQSFLIDAVKTIPAGSYIIIATSNDKISYQKLIIK